jgi:cellobiose PTS system EIIB component
MVSALKMSSLRLENKTKAAAAARGIPFELKALCVQEVARWNPSIHWYDIVLIAPQVFYKCKVIQKTAKRYGILVESIERVVFGMVDGEKLIQQILDAIRARDEEKAAN